MFEFNISYLEEGYHKEGDRPFSFPPSGVDNRIDGNLIEIDISKYNSFPKIALVCLKHKTICHSGICLDERTKPIIDTDEDLEMLQEAFNDYLEDVKYLKKRLDK